MTEPDLKIENFVFPCVIGIRDSDDDGDESNCPISSSLSKCSGGNSCDSVMMLLMLTSGSSSLAMTCNR